VAGTSTLFASLHLFHPALTVLIANPHCTTALGSISSLGRTDHSLSWCYPSRWYPEKSFWWVYAQFVNQSGQTELCRSFYMDQV